MQKTDKKNRREFLAYAGSLAAGVALLSSSNVIGQDEPKGTGKMFTLKLALCNEMFEAWNTERGFDFPRVFEFIKKCGYDGVEIAPFTIDTDAFRISAARRVEIRREAEKAGLEITGLHWLLSKTEGYYLTSPDAVIRQKTAGYFQELTRLCADLGGHVMVLGSPKQRNLLPGVTKEKAYEYAAETLGNVVPLLEHCGVTIALEPLAPNETDFLANADEAVKLLKMVDAPKHVSLLLDCKAMVGGEKRSIPDLIRKHKDYMTYFHLNDPNLRGPGFGDLDFVPIVAALREIGYAGWASVEVFDYTPGLERLAQDSLSHMKKCIDQVNHT